VYLNSRGTIFRAAAMREFTNIFHLGARIYGARI